jgi:hypothetical protein
MEEVAQQPTLKYKAEALRSQIADWISYTLVVCYGEHRDDERVFSETYNDWKPSPHIPSFEGWVSEKLAALAPVQPKVPLRYDFDKKYGFDKGWTYVF